MNSLDFNDSEAQFIAKEIILNRLNIIPKNAGKKVVYSDKIRKTLLDINNLEKTWFYSPKDDSHTYGRKTAGEKIGFWSVPAMSARVLSYLALYLGAKNVLEIGTSAGYSTIHLAAATNVTGGNVNTIECLHEKVKIAKNNFDKAGVSETVNLIEKDALEVLTNWKGGKIDLVFLDADKENYGKYFDLIVPLLSKNGIIVADNINDYGHMMEDYLQRVSGTHLPKSRCDSRVQSTYVAQLDNGLMITKKI